MRGIWSCCNKNYAPTVKSCAVCKTEQTNHKSAKKPGKPAASKETAQRVKLAREQKNRNNRILSKLPNPEEGKFYISTFPKKKDLNDE